ncbi:MAG: preprotein translocase subunit SecG [Zetaproteobacteria bacterium]|nr:preprotein translocase subunit SecG [Zetaproteobacteria bacterium]
METFVEIVHIILCLFMILVILVQGGSQGGVGATFGGGNTQGVFGASGATSFLGKLTYGTAIMMLFSTITLTNLMGRSGNVGLSDRLKQESAPEETLSPQQDGVEEKDSAVDADESAQSDKDLKEPSEGLQPE